MSQSANVRSVEAIQHFKVALTNFADDARNALGGVEMEIKRTRDWLLRDQLGYWQSQVKRRNEALSMARTELHRRRLSQQGSDAISDTEQKENVRNAQRKLEEAEQKVVLVKKWAPVLEHAISEYHSTSQPLGDSLSGSLMNSLALLERMVASLDAYLATTAPSTPIAPPPTKSSGPSESISTGGERSKAASETVSEKVAAEAPVEAFATPVSPEEEGS